VSVLFPLLSGVPYIVEDSVDAETYEPNPIPLYPSTVAKGIAEIDPTWSLILPAGVTYTTASGYPIGTSPSTGTGPTTGAPEPDAAAMMLLGLALCGLRRRSWTAYCAAAPHAVAGSTPNAVAAPVCPGARRTADSN
jgi:MYXO-CTERM domain-containing protein